MTRTIAAMIVAFLVSSVASPQTQPIDEGDPVVAAEALSAAETNDVLTRAGFVAPPSISTASVAAPAIDLVAERDQKQAVLRFGISVTEPPKPATEERLKSGHSR